MKRKTDGVYITIRPVQALCHYDKQLYIIQAEYKESDTCKNILLLFFCCGDSEMQEKTYLQSPGKTNKQNKKTVIQA